MNTLRRLFRERYPSHQEEILQGKILATLISLEEDQMRNRRRVSFLGLLSSSGFFLSAVYVYGGTFIRSEFWSIISLIFSDVLVLANYWNDFFLSLLETLPALPLAMMLMPIFIFFIFLKMYFKTGEIYSLHIN